MARLCPIKRNNLVLKLFRIQALRLNVIETMVLKAILLILYC